MYGLLCHPPAKLPEPDALEAALLQHWPRARIEHLQSGAFALKWSIGKGAAAIEGRLSRKRDGVSLEVTHLEPSVDFALWLRPLLAPGARLELLDDATLERAEVTPATTAGQLLAALR
jgi:hypothetical protein